MSFKITILGEGVGTVRTGMSGCPGSADLTMTTETTGMSKGAPTVWTSSLHRACGGIIKILRESPLFILSEGEADL